MYGSEIAEMSNKRKSNGGRFFQSIAHHLTPLYKCIRQKLCRSTSGWFQLKVLLLMYEKNP